MLHWYEIESILGQGGFGITYLARDTNLNQHVAIKEFLPSDLAVRTQNSVVEPLSSEHEATYAWGLDRFIIEAQTLAQFIHPHIVRVYTVFEANNTAYMVMQYLEGEILEDAFKFGRFLDEESLRRILFELLDGVDAIHQAGFIHRDIKPQNILIQPDGSTVLLDFGSARQAIGTKTRALTAVVSPGYAPYEQYDGRGQGDKQGPWTDIYSLGAVLYRAITGKGPIDAMARVNEMLDGKDILIPTVKLGDGRYSPGFLAAIDRALAFKPQDRPQTVDAWRAMLDSDYVDVPLDPAPSDAETAIPEEVTVVSPVSAAAPVPTPDTRPTPSVSSSRGLTALVIVVVLILGTGLGWWITIQKTSDSVGDSISPVEPDTSTSQERELAKAREAAEAAARTLAALEQQQAQAEANRLTSEQAAKEEQMRLEAEQKKAEEGAARLAVLQAEQEALAAKTAAEEAKRLIELEAQPKAEEERLAEIKRQTDEATAALAALERQQAEEALRRLQAEQQSFAEEKRKVETEAAKLAEEKRVAEEAAARLAEEKRKAEEAARLAEEQRKVEEAARLAEEKRQAEEAAQLAEKKRQAEEVALLAEKKRQAEEAARLAEEQRQAEAAALLAEEKRQAEEAAQLAEKKRQAEEAARLAEEQRQAEAAALLAEEQRQAEEADKAMVGKYEETIVQTFEPQNKSDTGLPVALAFLDVKLVDDDGDSTQDIERALYAATMRSLAKNLDVKVNFSYKGEGNDARFDTLWVGERRKPTPSPNAIKSVAANIDAQGAVLVRFKGSTWKYTGFDHGRVTVFVIDLTNGRAYSQEGTGSSLDNLVRTVLADYKAQDPGQVISVVPASSESSAGAATTQELSDSPTYSVAVADIKISGNTGANEPVIKDAIYDALKSCVSIHPDVTLGYSYRQSKDEHRFDQIWSSSITNPRPKIGATQKGANGLRVKGALAVRFKGST